MCVMSQEFKLRGINIFKLIFLIITICATTGILPATMAMMIPMMLGRRKRDLRLMEHTLNNDLEVDLYKLAREYNDQQRKSVGP